jgi:hypothetical protein
MNVTILGAILAFLGTIIGGTIVTGGNYFLARMRDRTEAARAAEIQAGELKMAARLIASELQQNFLTLEFALNKKIWWRSHEELSTEAWKQYKHLLAPKLTYDTWDDLVLATQGVNGAIALCAAPRAPGHPEDMFLRETFTALTLLVEHMKKGRVGLMPYLL